MPTRFFRQTNAVSLTRRTACAVLSSFVLLAPTFAKAQIRPEAAPVNPAFVQAWNAAHALKQNGIIPRPSFGLVPSPVKLNFSRDRSAQPRTQSLYPATLDLRDAGRVSPVRDQGQEGACWAFSSLGSLESGLMPAESWDFSENNLKNTHGFDLSPSEGGNAFMATAYMTRGSGPVRESDDPYSDSSTYSPSGLPLAKYVQNVYFIPDRTGSLDNENLKAAISRYGGVDTGIHIDWNRFSNNRRDYYYSGSEPCNHAVVIVGWDDQYAASRFVTPAPGPGAFLCKNSWGTGFGVNGFFWVSYYDRSFGEQSTVYTNTAPANRYRRAYQYDPLGMTSRLGYGSSEAYCANVFTAVAAEPLGAVGFYAVAPGASYTVRIYGNPGNSPDSGTLLASRSGSLENMGYHTIALNSPVNLTVGQKFSVVLRVNAPGSRYPIAIERPIAGYSSRAVAGFGQSYISSNGSGWTDLQNASGFQNTNVCLKALTLSNVAPTKVDTVLSSSSVQASPGQKVTLRAVLTAKTGGQNLSGKAVNFKVTSYDLGYATTDSQGVATMTVSIAASTPRGSYKTTFTFAGDKDCNASSTTASLIVSKAASTLTVGDVTAKRGQTAVLRAYLRRADGSVLSGKAVTFSSNGYVFGTVNTDANGYATLRLPIGNGVWPMPYALTARFAGDAQTEASTANALLTITP